jgi:tRNA(fMet)-specific endonuclease VapC
MRRALDTDTVSLYLRGDPHVQARLLAEPLSQLAVPIVVVQELLAGWLPQLTRVQPPDRYITPYAQLHEALEFLSRFTILDFDAPAAALYTRLRTNYRRIGTNDLRLAAIALVNQAILVTRNVRDFGQIKGLATEDWP